MDSAKVADNSNGQDQKAQRLAELAALVDAVKQRVRNQYPETAPSESTGAICVGLPDLTRLARARDAAMGKMAAIGTVNPRPGGLLNNGIQAVKRAVSRSLNWFVRDQVVFNRQMIACIETSIETLADTNRTIHYLAGQVNNEIQKVRAEAEPLRVEARTLRAKTSELQDIASHWPRWREEWQIKLHENEVGFLKSVADLNAAVQQKILYLEAASQQRITSAEQSAQELHRSYERRSDALQAATASSIESSLSGFRETVTQLEQSFRDTLIQTEASFETRAGQVEQNVTTSLRTQHDAFELLAQSNAEAIQRSTIEQIEAMDQRLIRQARDFERLLATSVTDLQTKFYADLDRIRTEYERVIHAELRVVRQRLLAKDTATVVASAASGPVENAPAMPFDYARFAERFRGPEQYVTESQRFYVPYFSGRRHVLDIGCGRGEFLKLMQEAGVPAKGIEASNESVAWCRNIGLNAEKADLFTYLSEQPEASLDGIFCSQVVEHLPPARLPEMVRMCANRLATGGVLAIETPNPECLAIFATHFYLDPTHTRPVPAQLLAFYMEEFGLGRIEVHRRSDTSESMPEVAELPAEFRKKFFDGLDYAIIAYKL